MVLDYKKIAKNHYIALLDIESTRWRITIIFAEILELLACLIKSAAVDWNSKSEVFTKHGLSSPEYFYQEPCNDHINSAGLYFRFLYSTCYAENTMLQRKLLLEQRIENFLCRLIPNFLLVFIRLAGLSWFFIIFHWLSVNQKNSFLLKIDL